MSRYARAVDANQAEIVAALKERHVSVLNLSRVGGGCPDLLVGWRGRSVLVEIKDPSKPPSARKLQKSQETFAAEWRGDLVVRCETLDEVLIAIGWNENIGR